MNHLNQLIIEGNALDKAVFNEDAKVATFAITVERTFKNSNGEIVKEVSNIDVKTFDKIAERVAKEITKGRGVRIVGRLKQEQWTDSDDKHCSKIVVIADHVEPKPIVKKEVA